LYLPTNCLQFGCRKELGNERERERDHMLAAAAAASKSSSCG